MLTGVFLYASTTALTSDALLGWNCAFSFFSNIMYAVLYSYTPELFPTPQRGTGNALAATCNRVFGIMAVSIFLVSPVQREKEKHLRPLPLPRIISLTDLAI